MAAATPGADVSRSPLALLAVAGLVALAGCSAALPGGDASPSPDADLEPADPLYEVPLEDSSLLADHEAALEARGSFTVVQNATMNNMDGQRYQSRTRARVSPTDGTVYSTHRPEPVAQIYRYGNGTSYLQVVSADSRSYERNPPSNRSAAEWARQSISGVVSLVDFEHVGATTRRGERVHVYRATDPEDVNTSVLAPAAERVEVDLLNATLAVRESGLVTALGIQYTLALDSGQRSFDRTTRFSRFGTTDVSPPAWVDDARAATHNASE